MRDGHGTTDQRAKQGTAESGTAIGAGKGTVCIGKEKGFELYALMDFHSPEISRKPVFIRARERVSSFV